MADKTNNIIYRIEVDSKSGKLNIDGVTKSFEQADKAFLKLQKDVAKGIPNATKNVKNLGDATGSATSATMELSRVISDAPYGIRGMANNITQLVSQLGTASTKAGGLTGALKLMWKQMMGPLGIVFAITAAVSALDFFFGANKKAEDSTSKASESIGGQATKLLALKDALEDSSMSREEANDAVNAANKEFKEFNLQLDENNKLTDDSVIAINNKIEALVNLSKAQALQSLLEEKYSELLPLQSKQTELDTKAKKDNAKAIKAISASYKEHGTALAESSASSSQAAADSNREAVKKIEKDISDLLKLGGEDGIIDLMFKGTKSRKGKEKKISPFKTPKELDIDIKNAENAIIQYEKKIEDARLKEEFNEKMSTAKTEEEKEKIRRTYQRDRLLNQIKAEKLALELKKKTEIENVKLKTSSHKADLKRIYDKYIFELSLNKKLSDEEKKKLKDEATGKFGIANIQATGEENISIQEITDKYTPLFSLFQKLSDARLSALFSMPSKKGKKDDKAEEYDLEAGLNSYMELQQGLTSFMDGEFSRQITIEQNKTNAINNELRERLNNENLSAGERKNIQLQIARNDEALRKKQEKIEKKRFRMQKAANISQALIETYLAAAKALKTFGGVPTGLPAMSATIATGLLNVATIARQKFQSSAGATVPAGALGTGGGSGGGNDRSFNFNLAGASRENQLAQTLQGRFDQPLQAYVVSRDITNQQQLDLDIENNASFG